MFNYGPGLPGLNQQSFFVEPGQGMFGDSMKAGSGQNLEGFGNSLGGLMKRVGQGGEAETAVATTEGEAASTAAVDGSDFWNILKDVVMAAMAGG